jgi:uncharacterized protein YutE (UPF0331/DUF86 family)
MKKSRDNSHNPGREAASADPEPDFQPTEEDTLALIGKLLLLTQDTKHQISWVLRVVFKDGLLTAEDFVRKDKKTLGQLVRTMRKNMQVEESFEGLLLAFVEQRNLFVHELRYQEWFNLDSEKNINRVWDALGRYMYNLEQVALTFTAYCTRFAEDIKTPKDEYWHKLEASGFLPHLRDVYYPKLGYALKPKRKP